jgi:acetyl-CoA acetyltransferase
VSWGKGTPLRNVSGQVAICGIGESDYSGPSGRHPRQMAAAAIECAITDAGLTASDIDGIMYTDTVADQFNANDFRAHFGTSADMWESPEGGAMVWAATAPYQAAQALQSGKATYIVNSFAVDWATRRPQMTGGPGAWHASELVKSQLELPFGWFPQPVYFATFASRHMHQYGTTCEQLGHLVTTFRQHANSTPGAVMHGKPLSLADYLARPPLAEPLRVEDCCLISDGAAAYIMTTPERARDLPTRPAIVTGIGHGRIDSAPYISQQGDLTSTPQVFAAPGAYAMAGITPADIDVLAVYDCFSITALMQIEDMGFCRKGEGGTFVEKDRLHFSNDRRRGGLPTNTHGGLLSHAYVLGIAHVVELVRQLRGAASNQVPAAEVAAYAGFTADEAATLILSTA